MIVAVCLFSPTVFAQETEFERIRNGFAALQTVAGNGAADDGNDWAQSNEGGKALEADLSRPHMTVADGEGNLYIADKESNAIRLVKVDGTIHTFAGTGEQGFNGDGLALETQLAQPNGIYRLRNGTILVLDLFNRRIRKIVAGIVTTVIHDEAMALGRGLWGSDDGKLIYYCSGSRVMRWREGEGLDVYAEGFSGLGNLDVDPQGRVVATDRGAHTVVRIEDDGSKTVIAGNGRTSGGGSGSKATETGLNEVRGVTFLSDGGYFLCTHRDSQVWYVDTTGIIHLLIDGDRDDATHSGDGELLSTSGKKISEPRAVSLSPTGDLIITENDRGYIRLVEKRNKKPMALGGGIRWIEWIGVPGMEYDFEGSSDLLEWETIRTLTAEGRVNRSQVGAIFRPVSYLRIKALGTVGE